MALPFAPHTVTVQAFSEAKSGRNVVNNATYTAGPTLKVCINAKDPSAAYQDYGVEWTRPHKMLMDVADAGKVKHQDRIVLGARTFRVETPVRISQHGLATDHASVMLEELP